MNAPPPRAPRHDGASAPTPRGPARQPPRARGGVLRRPLLAGAAAGGRAGAVQRALAGTFTRQSWLPIVGIVGAHIVFGIDDFPVIARAIFAIPALLFVMEARAFLRSERRELPFVLLAMFQYYVSFGAPIFFEIPFYDLGGPVIFSEATRIQGSLAVALGSLGLWGGARLALHFGGGLSRRALAILPPATVGAGWDQALYVYSGMAVTMSMVSLFAPSLIPGAVGLVLILVLLVDFAIGLAVTRPPQRLGRWAGIGLTGVGISIGLLNGQVEPMVRSIMAFVAARWVATRRIAIGAIGVMTVLFLVVQPVKSRFRDQVWRESARTGQQVGIAGRVDALELSLSSYFTDSSGSRSKDDTPAMARLSQLSPVMHALVVVPARVDYAYGATFAQILYSPIPRIIWPDKPTSVEEIAQQYAVIFGLQTQSGSRSTAIGMCLLVEGFWNFGWPGFAIVGFALGALLGLQQRLFAGEHWALPAAGVAQLATVLATVPLVIVYGLLFQLGVARLLGVWLVYGLSQMLGKRVRRAPMGSANRVARGRGRLGAREAGAP